MDNSTLIPLMKVPTERPWATERKLRRMVAEHRVRFYKVDHRIFFDLRYLDEYAEAGRVEAV
jgi:hypothetical protein